MNLNPPLYSMFHFILSYLCLIIIITARGEGKVYMCFYTYMLTLDCFNHYSIPQHIRRAFYIRYFIVSDE